MPHSLANCKRVQQTLKPDHPIIYYIPLLDLHTINRKIRYKTIYLIYMFWPSPLVTQTILTILFLQEDNCNISLEISSQLPTEAAHTAASGSVTGVTDVTGVNEFNVDVSTFAPTVPEASAPKWTFSTFLAVLVEYLGFVLCIMMLLLLPCFTVNRSTKDTTTPMPSRFIKVALLFGRFQTCFKMSWNLQNTIYQVILREL